jgi:hypothetical protein
LNPIALIKEHILNFGSTGAKQVGTGIILGYTVDTPKKRENPRKMMVFSKTFTKKS